MARLCSNHLILEHMQQQTACCCHTSLANAQIVMPPDDCKTTWVPYRFCDTLYAGHCEHFLSCVYYSQWLCICSLNEQSGYNHKLGHKSYLYTNMGASDFMFGAPGTGDAQSGCQSDKLSCLSEPGDAVSNG